MSGSVVLAGDLSFVSLADCFQILGGNNSSGTLQITSPFVSSPGLIHFVDGNPVNGQNGAVFGIDAIYSLFGWAQGSFEFIDEPVQVERVVHHSRMEIVLDALRMLDDGLIEKVGPQTCRVVMASEQDRSGESKRNGLPLIRGPLVDYMHVIDEEGFRDGAKIVTEGGHGNWIWVILEGTVKITRETTAGTMDIGRLAEGCFIGTLTSFLQRDYVRTATVTAEGSVQLGVLDTQRLHREFASLSRHFRNLVPGLDGRLKKVTERAIEVFEGAEGFISELGEDEKLILKEGTSRADAYLIKDGGASVVLDTSRGYLPLLTLEGGEFFGSLPFLDMGHEPRGASVIGKEALDAEKLDVGFLQKEYENLSGTFKNLIDNTCACVSVTTRLISRHGKAQNR